MSMSSKYVALTAGSRTSHACRLASRTAMLAGAVVFAFMSAASGEDIEPGKTVFKKCAACHAVDVVTNKVGPHLGNVIGRTAGTASGFKYSKAMVEAGAAGLVWDEATLAEFLATPKAKVPGTTMAFAGLKKPDEVQNVIAYLKSLSK